MADQSDVRRIALSFPGVLEGKDRFAFSVENKGKQKGFAWVWLERVQPRKARVPVLVRLPKVPRALLHKLLAEAWRCQAPRELAEPAAARPARRARRGGSR